MRKLFTAILIACIAVPAAAQVQVRGYVKKDGTYVAPHVRTAPNNTRFDNYSTAPNYNPNTGRQGTKDPYPQPTYQAPKPQTYQSYKPTKAPCYFNCPK